MSCRLTHAIKEAWAFWHNICTWVLLNPIGLVYAKVTSPRLPFSPKSYFLSNRQIRINMKKRNEDNHNNLGEPDDQLPAETLKMINELLERLHRLRDLNILKLEKEGIEDEKIENEKSVQINIYEKGSQHIDKQINIGAHPCPPKGRVNRKGEESYKEKEKGTRELPKPLATEKAMMLWEKAQEAGFVDEDYLPLLSHTQSALLADAMATRLGIREKWKVFETLWNRTKMYKDYYQALEQKQSLAFQDKLKQLFA